MPQRAARRPPDRDATRVFLIVLAVALAGLFLPGVWGAAILYAMVAFLAWLLTKSWATVRPPVLIFRLLMLAVLAAVATVKLLG